MRMRLACLLPALIPPAGCHSVSPFLFPDDAPDMGPTDCQTREARQYEERSREEDYRPIEISP